MSGFKGKPGPWHWEGKVLCNDEHIVGGDSWVFNDADKRLIAAAPELLEALQEFVDLFPDVIDGDAIMPALDKGMAAIAKALGNN
ncbi:hypothetical protein [Mixta calida]|uniref:hypothetical protein n=1 Tax=Mixta calida TaxID=665913 RepID=UPI0034D5DD0D